MSEQNYQVTDQEMELAVQAISAWHQERGVGFVLVNTGSIIAASAGKPLSLEASLHHAYEMMRSQNAIQIAQMKEMAQAANAAAQAAVKTETE